MPGLIYIADRVATRRMALKAMLTDAYYDVETCDDLADLADKAEDGAPDLVILDNSLVAGDGFRNFSRLCASEVFSSVSFVLVGDCPMCDQLKGLAAGADDFIGSPLRRNVIQARVRNLIRAKQTSDELALRGQTAHSLGLGDLLAASDEVAETVSPMRVIFPYGTDTGDAMLLSDLERRLGKDNIKRTLSVEGAVTLCQTEPPDAVIVPRLLEGGRSGLRLIARLRGLAALRHTAILSLVDSEDEGVRALGPDVGANDFMILPADREVLIGRLETQIRRARRTEALRLRLSEGLKMAVTDPLTGLHNKRYLMHHLPGLLHRARDSHASLAVMMLDLDRFKRVNDVYGHPVGDEVLRELAKRLQSCLRGADLVARTGGEEFFVALPDAHISDAAHVAERIRSSVESKVFARRLVPAGLDLTISIGVAMVGDQDQTPEDIVERADKALYSSKNSGRNCVSFAAQAVA